MRIRSLFFQVVDCRRIVVYLWSSFLKPLRDIESNPAEDLFRLTTAYLNRIATAVPKHDVHGPFVVFAEMMRTG